MIWILFSPGINENKFIMRVNSNISYNDYCVISEQFSSLPAFAALLFSIAKRRDGVYVFPKKVTLYGILKSLLFNKQYMLKIHLRAGATIDKILQQINTAPGLTDKLTERISEHDLLSNTYYYKYGTSRNKFISLIKKEFVKTKKHMWQKYYKHTRIKNIDEAVILASIVVRECEMNEYEQVANVFLNRLEKGMRLQSCSTIIYLLEKKGVKTDKIFYKDLLINDPINTYLFKGLPPNAIGIINKQALKAVLSSKKTNQALFFVKTSNLGHFFTESYKMHLLRKKLTH